MSQSFSLYTELTVRQNLVLHARLYHLPPDYARSRIAALIERFSLGEHVDTEAAALPLGIRQRLSLAVAIVHEPDLLILDEPTSGVDPLARDAFWELLIDLSRNRGVTIFVSTHFMNEAERCDRIAMMHAGRVLASGKPAELIAARRAATLEDAFISYLQETEQPLSPAPLRMLASAERMWSPDRRQRPAAVGLHDPRMAGAMARSGAAGVRGAWHCLSDANIWLRHQHRCGPHRLRGTR